MKAEAEFFFESDDLNLILEIYQSLLPEAGDPISDRSAISLKVDENRLVLNIQSDDVISLRSALNTWLRLIQTAFDVAVSSS
ncbi:KEOPS complex subunit Pcc1 [Methanolapillus millepedarum]|uniref:KEOPS complex subunit Pcc1 n=1 Tax=Methanolapillus millepedarum TaxID=3028296 RepID=A0AA97A333_9EURY|nr:hypothetical protein MsAc7_01620 [Methanosarcinaceae archaeon Ac7]